MPNRRHVDGASCAHKAEAILPEATQAHLRKTLVDENILVTYRGPFGLLYSMQIVRILSIMALMTF
jgi:hypothetical protein